jgi:hypothetical protein
VDAFKVGAVYVGETVDFWFKQETVVVEGGGRGRSGCGRIGQGRPTHDDAVVEVVVGVVNLSRGLCGRGLLG